MTGKFDRNPWRKLYCVEKGSFAQLPLYVRGLACELLKYADDQGRLFVGDGDPTDALGRLMGAHTGDRRLLRRDIPALLTDGFIVRDGGHLVIRNMLAANPHNRGHEPITNRARVGHEPITNRARTEHEPTTNQNEPTTKTEPTARNDSTRPLAGARASEKKRIDQNRIEEIREAPAVVVEDEPSPTSRVLTKEPTPQPPAVAATPAGSGAPGPAPHHPAPALAQTAPATGQPEADDEPPPASVPGSHRRYIEAYGRGVATATGRPYVPPTSRHEFQALGNAIATCAKDGEGKALRGDALLAWITQQANSYATATASEAQYQRGFAPSKFADWLSTGAKPTAARPRPGAPSPQPPPAGQAPNRWSSTTRRAVPVPPPAAAGGEGTGS